MITVVRKAESYQIFVTVFNNGTPSQRLLIESSDLPLLEKLLEIFHAFDMKVFEYDDPGYDVSDL